MKNGSNRSQSRPVTTCVMREVGTGNGTSLVLPDSWIHGANIVFALDHDERRALRDLFPARDRRQHYDPNRQMNEIGIGMRKVRMCLETGRASDEQYKLDRGFKVEVTLVKSKEGIEITLHLVSLTGDDGYPYFLMNRKDEKGVYVMSEGGEHEKVTAALTIKRVFPQDRLAELLTRSDVLESAMYLRNVELDLIFRGEMAKLEELRRLVDTYDMRHLPRDEGAKPTKLVSTSKESQGAGKQAQGQKKGKIKIAKIPVVSKVETADDRTDALARELTLAATGYDPGVGVSAPTPMTVREAAGQTKSIRLSPRSVRDFKDIGKLLDKGSSNGQSS